MSTHNRMQRHWAEVRDFIKRQWPKFTDVELDRIGGDNDKLFFYLREYYNDFPRTEALARDALRAFFDDMDLRHPERIVPDR